MPSVVLIVDINSFVVISESRTHWNASGLTRPRLAWFTRVYTSNVILPVSDHNGNFPAFRRHEHVRSTQGSFRLLVASERKQWRNPLSFRDVFHQAIRSRRDCSGQADCIYSLHRGSDLTYRCNRKAFKNKYIIDTRTFGVRVFSVSDDKSCVPHIQNSSVPCRPSLQGRGSKLGLGRFVCSACGSVARRTTSQPGHPHDV